MSKEFLYENANKVLGHITPNEDGTKEIGIEIILAILSMLPSLYKCWQDHHKAASRVQSPTPFDRMTLRRAVRRKLRLPLYRKHGDNIVRGILALGAHATADDVKKFIDEAGAPQVA